jgi:hypothetical protein
MAKNLSGVTVRVRLRAVPEFARLQSSGLLAIDVVTGPTIVTAAVTTEDYAKLAEAPSRYAKWSAFLSGKIAHVERNRVALYRCWLRVDDESERSAATEAEGEAETPEAREAERCRVRDEIFSVVGEERTCPREAEGSGADRPTLPSA